MATNTDAQFTARFPGVTAADFVGNQKGLADFTPTTNTFNTGMLSDIGRAYIYAPEVQPNFYSRFLQSPLARGDSVMSARFAEINSKKYDPLAESDAWFDGAKPAMTSNVATKNLSRQIRLEVNDYWTKQFCQTEEMIDDAMAAIMASQNACYMDDMWVASKEYFSGSTRSAKATQSNIMTAGVGDAGFGEEMTELLWKIGQKQFGYKSTSYNASGYNTRSDSISIALKKDVEFPAFKKLLSETYNPELLKVQGTIDYVDDFATPAGAPSDAGELIGMVVDNRAFKITPLPEAVTTEATRLSPRKSTLYTTTYEYIFEHDPFFNCAYIYAPKA